jgi:hypothetical protein
MRADLRRHVLRALPSSRPDIGSTTLNGLQVEVARAAREQRLDVLDQRRLHEAVARGREVVEQRARSDSMRAASAGQHVVDRFGQDPVTHAG